MNKGTVCSFVFQSVFANSQSCSGLPPPMRPTASRYSSEEDVRHGSLSDYSDYASSDEETHNRASGSGSQARNYVTVSDDDELDVRRNPRQGLLEEDPFADPFRDP